MKRTQQFLAFCALVVGAGMAFAATPTVNLYVSATGSDLAACTRTAPCKTVERACQVADGYKVSPVVVSVGSGTFSAGCHVSGRWQKPAGADWTTPSALRIRGTLSTYAPADAGTGTALLGWVAAGSGATRDVWGFDGGTYNADELKGMLACVTSGTGAINHADGPCWPVATNAGDRMTVQAVSLAAGPTAAPAAGSGVTFKTWATTISGDLGATVKPATTLPQSAVGGSFVVTGNTKGVGNESALPLVSIERLKFSGPTSGALFNGPVAFRENWCHTTTGACFRALDGVSYPTLERNVKTSTGDLLQLGNGASASLVQAYNNLNTGTASKSIAGPGLVGQILQATNDFTAAADAGVYYSPMLTPVYAGTADYARPQRCFGTVTLATGVGSVVFWNERNCTTFASAPRCGCTEFSDGGTVEPCAAVGAASTTGATFLGDVGRGASSAHWWCEGYAAN